MAAGEAALASGSVLVPGDAVLQLPERGQLRIGPGLQQAGQHIVASRAGVLRTAPGGKFWLDGRHKRYTPAAGEPVVGTILERHGDAFAVDINGPCAAVLPVLAFESATRRNRPNLAIGDLVYARVAVAARDMEPELACTDATGKASGFGPLTGGYQFAVPTSQARALLGSPRPAVLSALGAALKFELAVGLNGRVWVSSPDVATTILVANAIQQAEPMSEAQAKLFVKTDAMADTKLNMSLDDIIEVNTKPKGAARQQRPKRTAPVSMDDDKAAPTRGGVRKLAAARRKATNAAVAAAAVIGRTRQRKQKRDGNEDDAVVAAGIESGEFIKVGGTSQTRAVAGKIAHEAREGQPPALLAKGSASLNQAIKAVAVARSYLQEDDADLTCQPAFRDDKQLASLALYLAKRRPLVFPTEGVEELTVGKDSNPHLIAGAIAARVREDKPVALTSIGEHAATIAMRAICSGRLYLEEDNCDIKALIQFEEVQKSDRGRAKTETLNALRFNILVEDV